MNENLELELEEFLLKHLSALKIEWLTVKVSEKNGRNI